jgi:N-acetyl-anhydromuramyl-L-alanine amidase AmpD
MHTRGFADIGYQFVIDAGGRVYEGRSLDVRGAHTGGHNTGTVGIVLLGNFEEGVPAEAQLVSLERLSRHLADTYGITHLAGHRDFQPEETVCPGHNLAILLPELAQEFGLVYGTEGYVGSP